MNFQSFEYFTVLARERSYTHAAAVLHITQQSLSAHIAGLEKELRCQLVVRRVPLELTYGGEAFLRYATQMRRLQEQLQREFCDIAEHQKGELRVGIAHTRGRLLLPPVIARFQQEYPQMAVRMVEDANDRLQKRLLEGEIDLAIARFPQSLPEVQWEEFYREEIVLLVSRTLLPQEPEDEAAVLRAMADCPLVIGSAADIAGRIGRELLERAGVVPNITAQSDNVETLLALCVQGAGACFCPANLVEASLSPAQLSRLRRFSFADASYPIRFGYRKHCYQWSVMKRFIELAREVWTQDGAQLRSGGAFAPALSQGEG